MLRQLLYVSSYRAPRFEACIAGLTEGTETVDAVIFQCDRVCLHAIEGMEAPLALAMERIEDAALRDGLDKIHDETVLSASFASRGIRVVRSQAA